MRRILKTTAVLLAFGATPSLFPVPARAQMITQYSTTFDGPSGLPEDWSAYTSSGSGFSIGQNGSGSLVFARSSDSTANRGAALYTGDSGSITDGLVSDAAITLTYQIPNALNWTGIVARAQSNAFNPSGYYAVINWNLSTMAIFENAPTTTGNATGALSSVAIPGTISRSNTYQFVFTLSGNNLTAALYAENAQVGVDDPLLSVSASDDSYSSGTTGTWAFLAGVDRSAAFQSYAIAVPETGTHALVTLGIGILLAKLWRKRRNVPTA